MGLIQGGLFEGGGLIEDHTLLCVSASWNCGGGRTDAEGGSLKPKPVQEGCLLSLFTVMVSSSDNINY